MTWKAWLAAFVGAVLGFAIALSVQAMLDGYIRSTAKRVAADCLTVSEALEAYRRDNAAYPPLDGDIQHLSAYLVPKYLRHVPTKSGMSGEPYLVVMNGARVAVIAPGRYGAVVEAGKLVSSPSWEK
jgi:hypothetical protein